MPFIPHTENDVRAMLETIGIEKIDDLFDEIPAELKQFSLEAIPQGMTEMEIAAQMNERANTDGQPLCFAGAGAYDHHIPAAVWQITTRGELYSAYTPYQAEASQGTLQILYEYQSMMTALMAMEVSNASLYDGASGLAESILMALRAIRGVKQFRVLLPRNVHPVYRAVVNTIVGQQGIELIEVPFDLESGQTDFEALEALGAEGVHAFVIAQPNFFGVLEDVDALTDWAHAKGAQVIAVVNPLVMSVLKPPGEWGETGVDICCGEGQPLGVPLSSGGPYFGFMCCKKALVRQMPGRIVGKTVDLDGNEGFTLTLQAREQHIRRGKATSNICTNQGLLVTAATVHMAIVGGEGLARTAGASHENTHKLLDELVELEGVEQVFSAPAFHESVIRLPVSSKDALKDLAAQNVLAGIDLGQYYPELENTLLVCATEKRTDQEIESFVVKLDHAISGRQEAS